MGAWSARPVVPPLRPGRGAHAHTIDPGKWCMVSVAYSVARPGADDTHERALAAVRLRDVLRRHGVEPRMPLFDAGTSLGAVVPATAGARACEGGSVTCVPFGGTFVRAICTDHTRRLVHAHDQFIVTYAPPRAPTTCVHTRAHTETWRYAQVVHDAHTGTGAPLHGWGGAHVYEAFE